MSKHTPGPWKLIWHGTERYPFPLSVCSQDGASWVARDGTVSSEANAALIAAAPELLEVLRGFVLNGAYLKTEEPFEGALKRLIELAREAVAKAEGRS